MTKSSLRPIRISDDSQFDRLLGVEKLIWISAIEGLSEVLQDPNLYTSPSISPLQDVTTWFCLGDENQVSNEVAHILRGMSYDNLGQMDLAGAHANQRQYRAAQIMMRAQGCDDTSTKQQCLEAIPKAIAFGWSELQRIVGQYPDSATCVTPLNVFRIMPEGVYEGGLDGNEWETEDATE